jgi:hypothetical protein
MRCVRAWDCVFMTRKEEVIKIKMNLEYGKFMYFNELDMGKFIFDLSFKFKF